MKKILFLVLKICLGALAIFFVWYMLQFPSLDRDWSDDGKILASVSIEGDLVRVKNVRDFDYRSTTDYTPNYYDAVYDTRQIVRAWYIIEPFGGHDGPAHTMLAFDFDDGQFVTVSAEIRKEVGESFDAIKGLLRQYELVYIIGSDRDLIRLRSNYRRDPVIMYPLRIQHHNLAPLFISVITRAEKLTREPEWYNTITNTCTTAIQDHANDFLGPERQISWSKQILLPKYSDEIAYNLGLIDTELSLESAREYYSINSLAMAADQDSDFSGKIRSREIR